MLPGPPKLLLVDDQIETIELLEGILGEHYQLHFALDGETALALALALIPDLILLDVLLPGGNGFEVLTRLKADPLTASIPVIFITGLTDAQAETRGLQLGAADYLTKPINPAVARARIENHLALKQARDQLLALADSDGLTGIANRRSFDAALAAAHVRHLRSGAPLGLLLIDIDHFKEFNDSAGHVAGDDCLRAIAAALRGALAHHGDLAARYGGDEFAALLAEVDPVEGIAPVAADIAARVQRLAIPHPASPLAAWVTLSIGGSASRCGPGSTPTQLLVHADAQLYRAKRAGRNCIALADDRGPQPIRPGAAVAA